MPKNENPRAGDQPATGAKYRNTRTRPGHSAKHGSPRLHERACYCGSGATTCLTCLAWSRLIHAIEARRTWATA